MIGLTTVTLQEVPEVTYPPFISEITLPLLSAKYTHTCDLPEKHSHSNKKALRGT
jgi:hypothetical protein